MASSHTDSPSALRQSVEIPTGIQHHRKASLKRKMTFKIPQTDTEHSPEVESNGINLTQDNCDGKHDGADSMITMNSTTKMAGKTVAPFLAKHIPEQYAPLGEPLPSQALQRDSNTKYCYRHRPDSKCRRTADEPTMEILQQNLESLTQADQQGISHVWSLFSAAPAKHRNLMLQGILAQCCFPQLSYISNSVKNLIRIDFIAALPSEISFKILCYLDTTSLCKAAQVSTRWRLLADDDVVWHKMCEQHIDRKCTKCGWGLPLLERKRLRDWKREQQLRATGRGLNEWSPNVTPMPEDGSTEMVRSTSLNGSNKRGAHLLTPDDLKVPGTGKRQRMDDPTPSKPKFRPWKDVYKDRFKVGTNWKHGRFTTKVFSGHLNGVMCLQFDDNVLATGSYDTTIKIWNMDTGECVRTLQGHTSGVRTLQFDDTKLISGSLDKTIKVWNWRTGECMSTLEGHAQGVITVNFEDNFLASGSIDRTVRIWNFQDKSTCTLSGHKDWVNAVKVDAASRTVFSASDDCTVRLWDLDTKKTIRVFDGHVGQVQQVLLMPPEYEPEDVDIEELDDSTSSMGSNYESPPPATISTFASWPSSRPRPSRFMMTAGLDSTIRLWDVETGRCLKTFFGHVEGVWALAGDTLRVVSGAEDRMVKVWDARTGKCQRTFGHHTGPVTCIGLSDSRMVTGSEDCEVRLYSFRNDEVEAQQAEEPASSGTPS